MFSQSLTVCTHISSNYWIATGKEIEDRLDNKRYWGKTNMDHLLWSVIHWHKAIATLLLYYQQGVCRVEIFALTSILVDVKVVLTFHNSMVCLLVWKEIF
jgi:hypothetical protein